VKDSLLLCLPSNHFPVLSSLSISSLHPPTLINRFSSCFRFIRTEKFLVKSLRSRIITYPLLKLSDLVDTYNSMLSAIRDEHDSLKTKTAYYKSSIVFTSALFHFN
jgi:hypothetical protein